MSTSDSKDKALFAQLTSVAIDTIWTVLRNHGYPDMYIENVRPVHRDLDRKMAGRALTLKYLPIRKDLEESLKAKHPHPLHVRAAEEATPGAVMVVDAGGETGAGFWGDVIATRFIVAGGIGIVTDGAIRDLSQIRQMDVSVYARATHPAFSMRRMVAVDMNTPINCGGVTVFPGDVMVGDAEGVVVVPTHLADEVAAQAIHTEAKEEYIRSKLLKGAPILGLYPPNEAVTREFEQWRKAQGR